MYIDGAPKNNICIKTTKILIGLVSALQLQIINNKTLNHPDSKANTNLTGYNNKFLNLPLQLQQKSKTFKYRNIWQSLFYPWWKFMWEANVFFKKSFVNFVNKGPSLYNVSKGTGWGQKNSNFCKRSFTILKVGQKKSKNVLTYL